MGLYHKILKTNLLAERASASFGEQKSDFELILALLASSGESQRAGRYLSLKPRSA
ncbi:hypothetical protein A2U01_0105725, partial [Trifolium medium]|nr:hypothetical protein [Trifolium medium]